jgi:hypothetical protein
VDKPVRKKLVPNIVPERLQTARRHRELSSTKCTREREDSTSHRGHETVQFRDGLDQPFVHPSAMRCVICRLPTGTSMYFSEEKAKLSSATEENALLQCRNEGIDKILQNYPIQYYNATFKSSDGLEKTEESDRPVNRRIGREMFCKSVLSEYKDFCCICWFENINWGRFSEGMIRSIDQGKKRTISEM